VHEPEERFHDRKGECEPHQLLQVPQLDVAAQLDSESNFKPTNMKHRRRLASPTRPARCFEEVAGAESDVYSGQAREIVDKIGKAA
jgi:hypothetical protein